MLNNTYARWRGRCATWRTPCVVVPIRLPTRPTLFANWRRVRWRCWTALCSWLRFGTRLNYAFTSYALSRRSATAFALPLFRRTGRLLSRSPASRLRRTPFRLFLWLRTLLEACGTRYLTRVFRSRVARTRLAFARTWHSYYFAVCVTSRLRGVTWLNWRGHLRRSRTRFVRPRGNGEGGVGQIDDARSPRATTTAIFGYGFGFGGRG